MTPRLQILAAALGIAGCADGTLPPRGPQDPASPEAWEPPVTFVASSTTSNASTPSGTPVEGAYACPMHPDVTSDAPGRCPKCGMRMIRPPKGAP